MSNPALLRYALAIATTVTALLFMLALDPLIHLTQASFLLFFGAVTLTALYGGRNPGIVATLLSAGFASYFFLAPQHQWMADLPGGIRVFLFVLQGVLISHLVGSLRKAQEQAQQSLEKLQVSELEIKQLNQELQHQIDELTLAESTLRTSEQRFRRLVESNMFGVAFGDSDGGIHYANDYFLSMVGYNREDLLAGRVRWLDMTPPEFLPLDQKATLELKQTGVATPFEKEYIRKDGKHVPILIGATLLQEPYDQDQEMICFYIDLTERKRAEAAWQEGTQILDALMEYIPEGITIADAPDVTIRKVSQHGQQLAGRPLEKVMGAPASTHVEDWGIFRADGVSRPTADELPLTRAVRQSEVVVNEEWVVQRPDGSQISVLCNAGPIKDADGKTTGGILAWRDVTDRKQVEAEREQFLERERRARTEAENANRVKDEFLAVLSHELRSPLNPILGWSWLLQTKKLDEAKVAEALRTIERNARLQAELIEDLLDVSRILRGKLSLNVTPVDLATTIQAAIETVRLAAEAKAIQIDTHLETDIGQVSGDSSRLQQIVWNLLSNAVKFTPDGGRVTVRLEQVAGGAVEGWSSGTPPLPPHPATSGYAQITVRDTGKGISPEFLPHVFEYFRQADSTTTRKFGGLGLGLAIVRHLVELHGGTIQADSSGEGQGATFIVTLPLLRRSVDGEPGKGSDPSLPFPDPYPLADLRILVVDDDADSRELIGFLLEQEKAIVQMAKSASEALEVLPQFRPHVLLSDIGMPDMDGYALMQQVRARLPEQGGLIPAIALTAYAGEYDQRQALKAGFQQHIAKPIDPNLLVKTIVELMKDRA